MKPFVSFCIATYKRQQRLEGVLQSILSQSFKDYEIVITDNEVGSNTKGLIENLNDNRIRYYRNSANLGMVKSFNRALSLAKGKYVTMITDDDPIYPNMLKDMHDLSVSHPGHGAYFGACSVFIEDLKIAKLYGANYGRNNFLDKNRLKDEVTSYSSKTFYDDFLSNDIFPYFLWSCGIVDRKLAQNIGGMPDYGSPYLTDFGYILLAGTKNGAIVINKILGEQTIHSSNFGRKEFYELIEASENFIIYIRKKLNDCNIGKGKSIDLNKLELFASRWLVNHLLFVNKYQLLGNNYSNKLNLFNQFVFSKYEYQRYKYGFYFNLFLFKVKLMLGYVK